MKTAMEVLAIFGLVMVGCGGNTFSGTVQGTTLTPKGSIFDLVTLNDGKGDTAQALLLFVSDQTDLCTSLRAGHSFKSTTLLTGDLFTFNDLGTSFSNVANGKFEVLTDPSAATGHNVASVLYAKSDSSCNNTITGSGGTATGGTITLDSFKSEAGGTASGSFDISFSGTDTAKGTFNASWCDLQAALDSTAPTTCN